MRTHVAPELENGDRPATEPSRTSVLHDYLRLSDHTVAKLLEYERESFLTHTRVDSGVDDGDNSHDDKCVPSIQCSS